MTTPLSPEERIAQRLTELRKRKVLRHQEAIAWASNVRTMARQLLGPEDFKVREIETLIEWVQRVQGSSHSVSVLHKGVGGVLGALYSDFTGGYLADLRSQIRADVEADFLGQAHRLLENGQKDPAAMLLGAVLEDSLRQLCRKYSIPVASSIDPMNVALRKAGVFGQPQKDAITAWAAIRNKAAHGHFGEYDISQVRLMHQGLTDFVVKFLSQ